MKMSNKSSTEFSVYILKLVQGFGKFNEVKPKT